jgi:glucose uptake protein GlcU
MIAGYVAAGLAALFNGSFTSPYKMKSVADLNLHPILFTQYVSIGVFLSSLLIIPFLSYNDKVEDDEEVGTKFSLSFLGIIAGFLLVAALGCSFLAIEKIGVALAQGVFGGTAILVSYIWGSVIFGETPSNIPLSVVGVVLLLTGVLGIALNKQISEKITKKSDDPLLTNSLSTDQSPSLTYSAFDISSAQKPSETEPTDKLYTGIFWALCVGLSGGSILAPSHYADPDERGLAFLPSFGIGAMIASPLLTVIWFNFVEKAFPPLHLSTLPVGLFSGLLWNISNICAVIAIPMLGYAVAYPILQCALFVAGKSLPPSSPPPQIPLPQVCGECLCTKKCKAMKSSCSLAAGLFLSLGLCASLWPPRGTARLQDASCFVRERASPVSSQVNMTAPVGMECCVTYK